LHRQRSKKLKGFLPLLGYEEDLPYSDLSIIYSQYSQASKQVNNAVLLLKINYLELLRLIFFTLAADLAG
tara:strand:- start:118 stop:327 length:210 start_codon:yes stop_codon:yes gene_type:complete